jgi:hypothetical protein
MIKRTKKKKTAGIPAHPHLPRTGAGGFSRGADVRFPFGEPAPLRGGVKKSPSLPSRSMLNPIFLVLLDLLVLRSFDNNNLAGGRVIGPLGRRTVSSALWPPQEASVITSCPVTMLVFQVRI